MIYLNLIFSTLCLLVSLTSPSYLFAMSCKEQLTQDNYSVYNRFEKAEELRQKISEQLEENNNLNIERDWESMLLSSADILKNVIDNTLQHSSTAGLTRNDIPIEYAVYSQGPLVIVKIRNPKVKPFPKKLIRDFSPGESVKVPWYQRRGYRGAGIGHVSIFGHLESLPEGSQVRWDSDSESVTFTLKIYIE